MKNRFWLILVVCFFGVGVVRSHADKPKYLSVIQLQAKLKVVIDALQSGSHILEGAKMPEADYATKTYQGTTHFVKNDFVLAQDGLDPISTNSYKARLFISSSEIAVEEAYKNWENLFAQALPDYFSAATTVNVYREIRKTFYNTDAKPIKVEISKKMLFSDEWGIWIDISITNKQDDNFIELAKTAGKDHQLSVDVQADNLFTHQRFSSELTAKSPVALEERYYTHLPIYLEAGEIGYVIYRTKDFYPMLVVKNIEAKTQETIEKVESTIDSLNEMRIPVKAKQAGIYDFVFTTSEPGAMGKLTVDIFQPKERGLLHTVNKTFCENLNIIALHAALDFELIPKTKNDSHYESYTSTIRLLPEALNEIYKTSKYSYHSNLKTGKLGSLSGDFDKLADVLSSCLPTAKTKVYNDDELVPGEINIRRKIDFVVRGAPAYQISDSVMQYKVSIELVAGSESDFLKIAIE